MRDYVENAAMAFTVGFGFALGVAVAVFLVASAIQ